MEWHIKTYKNYILGQWVSSHTGRTYEVLSPINNEISSVVQLSDREDAKAAIDAAREAFDKSDWPYNHWLRHDVLLSMAMVLERHFDEMARLLSIETGKPIRESRSEVKGSIDMLKYAASMTVNIFGRSMYHSKSEVGLVVREPLGVVGIITPWNWPITLLVRSLAPALAMGNTVVIKPASYASGVVARFIELISEEVKNIPPGTINFVTGPGDTVGDELVINKNVDAIAFTGETKTGIEIMRRAADTLKKLILELGGKSPNVVFMDADFDLAVKTAINGVFITSGQVCFATTRLLVDDTIHDKFLDHMINIVKSLKVGNPLNEDTDIGPVISKSQMKRIMDYIEIGKKDAKLIVGGYALTNGEYAKGNYIAPTILDDVPPTSRVYQEEIFGPVLSVTRFKSIDEAIELANNTQYGLAAVVFTRDINKALKIAKGVKAGTIWVNTFGKHYPWAESGGYKYSGIGRQRGLDGYYAFTQTKHILINLQ